MQLSAQPHPVNNIVHQLWLINFRQAHIHVVSSHAPTYAARAIDFGKHSGNGSGAKILQYCLGLILKASAPSHAQNLIRKKPRSYTKPLEPLITSPSNTGTQPFKSGSWILDLPFRTELL